MSNKKTRNRHKNKPTKKQMLKMKKILGDAFGIDNSKLDEIPYMHNYNKKSFKEEIGEMKERMKAKRKAQEEADNGRTETEDTS